MKRLFFEKKNTRLIEGVALWWIPQSSDFWSPSGLIIPESMDQIPSCATIKHFLLKDRTQIYLDEKSDVS